MYVRIIFNSEGASPIALIKTMADLGFDTVMGEYDFLFVVKENTKHYRETLRRLHEHLRGLNVLYSITTKKD